MSQDELAEKLQVTRQSISLWETGQTQPSLDNIVELAKLFNIPVDALLTDNETESVDTESIVLSNNKSKRKKLIITICIVFVSILISLIALFSSGLIGFFDHNDVNPENLTVSETQDSLQPDKSGENTVTQPENNEADSNKNQNQVPVFDKEQENLSNKEDKTQSVDNQVNKNQDISQSPVFEKEQSNSTPDQEKTQSVVKDTTSNQDNTQNAPVENVQENSEPVQDKTQSEINNTNNNQQQSQTDKPEKNETPVETPDNNKKDLYTYLKDFVLKNGKVNGDYCYYSRSADNYGGYSSEDFSLYYWADTEKIEFCLHSVLDDEFSINFYIYVPKQHTGNYDYISSYYYRDTGEPIYEAKGVINAREFSKNSPINCSDYYGSTQVQNEFMEMSRQGICDLIDCLKNFITVEQIKYSFIDFGFTNF